MPFPIIRPPTAFIVPALISTDHSPDPEALRAIILRRLIVGRGLTPATANVVASLAGIGPSNRVGR